MCDFHISMSSLQYDPKVFCVVSKGALVASYLRYILQMGWGDSEYMTVLLEYLSLYIFLCLENEHIPLQIFTYQCS